MSVNVTNLGLVKIKSLASDPANTDAGLMYFNSVSGKFKFYNGAVWADVGGSSGANTALSNLASTAVNADILPNTNNSVDLGSSSKMFRSIYAYTNVWTNAVNGIGGSTSFDANNLWFTANGVNGPSVQMLDTGLLIRASNSDVLRELKIGKDRYNTTYTILRGTQSVAGDTLFQLPPDNGANDYYLKTDGTGVTSWAALNAANPALSNLSSVAINTSLLPASNNAISLGSSTLAYAEAHVVSSYIHASTTDFVVEKAVASTALAASSTTLISGLSFAHATYKSAIVHYQFSEATTNARRVGTLYVTTDGTTTSISDTNADTATIALDFSAAINGANLEISAVSTSSNICTFRAKQSLFLS